jgi:hypothetical protein
MEERDEIDGTKFGLKRDHCSIENRTGGTHPGAEQSTMCGRLVMGVMPGMLNRFRLC